MTVGTRPKTVMKKTVDSVLGRTEVRIGPEPAAMLRVGGCATAGRAAQQERRHDDAWNQDVIKTKTADTRATRYSLYVLHSTLTIICVDEVPAPRSRPSTVRQGNGGLIWNDLALSKS